MPREEQNTTIPRCESACRCSMAGMQLASSKCHQVEGSQFADSANISSSPGSVCSQCPQHPGFPIFVEQRQSQAVLTHGANAPGFSFIPRSKTGPEGSRKDSFEHRLDVDVRNYRNARAVPWPATLPLVSHGLEPSLEKAVRKA